MWKKILFIGLSVIIGLVVGVLSYLSGYLESITKTAHKAIENNEYDNAMRIFSVFFDYDSLIEGNKDTDHCSLYFMPSISSKDITYEEKKTAVGIQKSYSIYLFDIDYSSIGIEDVEISDDLNSNKCGFVFYNDMGDSDTNNDLVAHHYFKNLQNYAEYTKDDKEYNLITQSKGYQFLMADFTEEDMAKIGNKITRFALENSAGDEVFSYDVNFTFSEKFFSDIDELITQYNAYAVKSIEEKEFSIYYKEFRNKYSTLDDSYRMGYGNNQYKNSSLYWSVAGTIGIYSLVIVVIFFLLFKRHMFTAIKERRMAKSALENRQNRNN